MKKIFYSLILFFSLALIFPFTANATEPENLPNEEVLEEVVEETLKEEIKEPVQEEPKQEEVEEPKKEEITKDQIKDIVENVVAENTQGHVNEEQVLKIVEENMLDEIEYVPIDEAESIMLLIDFELDTEIKTDDGFSFYVPSELLKQYNYFYAYKYSSSEFRVYFFNEYSFDFRNSNNKLLILPSCCRIKVNPNANFGDLVSSDVYTSATSSGISYVVYRSANLYDSDNNLIFEKNVSIDSSFIVKFVTGYDNISFEPIQTDENGLVESLPVPDIAPNGFSFGGWYLDELYNTKVDETYKFTSNTTLYAKWVEIDTQVEFPTDLFENILSQIAVTNVLISAMFVYLFIHFAISKRW